MAGRQRLMADGCLLLAAAIWGTGFLFQKQAMAHLDPFTFIAARSSLAAIALAPLAVVETRRGGAGLPGGFMPRAILAAIVFVVAAFLQQSGLKTASVTNTGFLTSLYVVFTPIFAWLAFGRAPSRLLFAAILSSFAGAVLISGGGLVAMAIGDALIIASAAGWALHVVVLSWAGRFGLPIAFTAAQFAVVALLAACAASTFEQPAIAPLILAASDIAYVGLLSSALTFTLFTYAVRHTAPSEAVVIASTECLFAAAAGALVLGERLDGVAWSGAALIVAAVLLVQLGPRENSSSAGGAGDGPPQPSRTAGP
jgi:drug/metabolite transporter (DMT)-like permease